MTGKQAAKRIRSLKKGERKPDREWLDGLAKLVDAEDWKESLKYLNRGDTFMREAIPHDVGHHIGVQAAGGERIVTAKVVLNGITKVFNEGMGPGTIGTVDLGFPKDTPDEQVALALIRKYDDVIKSMLHVEYVDENGAVICKMP